MAIGEVVEKRNRVLRVASLDGGLRLQKVGVVAEHGVGGAGAAEGSLRVRVAAIEHVGVADGKVGGGRCIAGVPGGVGGTTPA